MGKVTYIALAVMFTFAIVGMLGSAMYDASNDENKTGFVQYQKYKNLSALNIENMTYQNNENSISNMQRAAEAMAQKIADSQSDIASNNVEKKILGAFGLLSAVTIDLVGVLLAVFLDGLNFVAGVAFNLTILPTPWNLFASVIGLAVAVFVVFTVFKIASVATGREF